jgi:hypothetical protein
MIAMLFRLIKSFRQNRPSPTIGILPVIILAVLAVSETSLAQSVTPPSVTQPGTAWVDKVQPTSPAVLQMFREAGMSPTEHTLSADEQRIVAAAFANLPPLHQRVLKSHLRSINFLDNMPNTALTSTVDPDEQPGNGQASKDPGHKWFDITFRAQILHQDVSEWLTLKERTCFDTTQSPIRVAIRAGHLSAFEYVLLHEATHVVDGALGISPVMPAGNLAKGQSLPDSLLTGFTAGVWAGHTVVGSKYQSPLLDSLVFRRGGKPVPAAKALKVYRALQQTPFVSLYARNSWNEDLAECLTIFHFTQKLRQPFEITVRQGNKIIFSYQPVQSARVRNRFKYLSRFYT